MKSEGLRRTLGTLTLLAAGFSIGTLISRAERAFGSSIVAESVAELVDDGSVDEKSRAVLDTCYKSMGGIEKLRSFAMRSAKGNVEIPAYGMKGPVHVVQASDGRMSQTTEIVGMGTLVRGFDGTHGWELQPGSPARLIEGEELEELVARTSMVFGVPLEPETSHRKIEHEGKREIEGETYDVLKAESRAGRVTMWYFARSNGLLMRESTVEQGPAGEAIIELIHTNPVTVQGITMPSGAIQRVESGAAGTMEIHMTTDVSTIKLDTSADDAHFTMPPEIRALIDEKK